MGRRLDLWRILVLGTAEPQKFRRAEALGEAVCNHIVSSNVLGSDLTCFVEPSYVVGFQGDVS